MTPGWEQRSSRAVNCFNTVLSGVLTAENTAGADVGTEVWKPDVPSVCRLGPIDKVPQEASRETSGLLTALREATVSYL